MTIAKQIILLMLFLLLLTPVAVTVAQQAEGDSSLSEEVIDSKIRKEEKKKAKVLEMNEMFLVSLGINLLNVALIILLIYFPNYRKLDYIFTFVMFNLVIFLLTFVLKYVKLSVGAAFGLFAVFSMLRYRTQGLSMKDLTYMFVFIAMGVISAIQLEYYQLIVIHAVILAGTFLLDGRVIIKNEQMRSIRYENIELIKPDNREALLQDLRNRTGLNIHRIVIGRINFLTDSATIKVYYYD